MKKNIADRLLPHPPKIDRLRFLKKRPGAHGHLSWLHIGAFEAALCIALFNLWRLTGAHPVAVVSVLVVAQCGIWYLLTRQRKKTKELIEASLPQAIEIIGRVYRIHPDMKVALSQVPQNMEPGPVAALFKEVHTLSSFGYSVEEAILRVNERVKSEDLAQVATAIRIHLPQGGDIASQMEEIAMQLRRGREVKREVGNAMFQNKVSSIFTSAFVPLIIILVFTINTQGYREILKNPTGRAIFLAALGWWAVGIIIMRRLLRVAL
jgi:tight adherence protein B